MAKKTKTKRPYWQISVFMSLLMLAFAWAVYSIGSSVDGISDLAANVIKQETKKRTRKIPTKSMRQLRGMLAQTPLPPEIIHPTFLCYTPEIENKEYKAEFMEKEIATKVDKGDEFPITMYVKNTGNAPWFSDRSGCSGLQSLVRLGTARQKDRESQLFYEKSGKDTGWVAPNRIALVEDRVDPGQIGTFHFTSEAPYKTDTYREYFQIVVEGVKWLESKEETVRVDIAVGETDPLDSERLKFINLSSRASVIPDPNAKREVTIDISEQKMSLKVGDVVVRELTVSTGTFKTPTPLGRAKIANKQDLRISAAAPHYRMPNWQGLAFERYGWQFRGHGLHALPYLANDSGVFWNEALNHIGQRVSHGCVRVLPEDAEDIFQLTAVGDSVIIQN